MSDNKTAAVDFLQLVVAGRIDEAYQKHVNMLGKHHNAYFAAGFDTLRQAMQASQTNVPDKKMSVKNVLADGDLVAVHSHLDMPTIANEMSVVHLFRFEGGKIAEMWDVGQVIPPDSPNGGGAF